MSQPRNPSDTQALLQSMLQRLRLQPGREGQVHLHSPVPNSAALTWGQDGEKGGSDLQGVNSSPVNGFEFRTNGLPTKEIGISSTEKQQAGSVREGDSHLVSFPTQKENTDSETGEIRVMGQDTKISKEPEQLFPAVSHKDVDISSSERIAKERDSYGSPATPVDKDATTATGQSHVQGQGFTPRIYSWSLNPAEPTGSQADKVLHMGNGGFEAKDLQAISTGKTNSLSRRQQRTTGNRTRRWTQKIKEKWRDRQGSFGKRGKEEEGGNNQKQELVTGMLPDNQLMTAETLNNTQNTREERMSPSLDSSYPSETSPAQTVDGNHDGWTRSTGDFDLGLGSFSLLEEIVTGQEWAKFLDPNQPSVLTNQKPSEELLTPQNHHDSVNLNQHKAGTNQWSFGHAETTPDVSMAQTSPGVFLPVSMDVSGGKKQQDAYREAGQPEPMEHGSNQSDMQSEESGQQQRPTSPLRPSDLLDNSTLKSRSLLNRKRQHQSAGRRDHGLQTTSAGKATGQEEESMTVNSEMTKETGEASHHNTFPSYTLKPLSPSSSAPPKGVLKHSISQDSESLMEVEKKRRRVEENRRVRFSEEVQTIPPPDMDLDFSDSEEEDSEAEEGSVDCEAEQAAMEEAAPARRPALPAWILALKRRNTGRKHR